MVALDKKGTRLGNAPLLIIEQAAVVDIDRSTARHKRQHLRTRLGLKTYVRSFEALGLVTRNCPTAVVTILSTAWSRGVTPNPSSPGSVNTSLLAPITSPSSRRRRPVRDLHRPWSNSPTF